MRSISRPKTDTALSDSERKWKIEREKKNNFNQFNRSLYFWGFSSLFPDQHDARLYGLYTVVHGKKRTNYYYVILKFDLIDNNSLFIIHRFIRLVRDIRVRGAGYEPSASSGEPTILNDSIFVSANLVEYMKNEKDLKNKIF